MAKEVYIGFRIPHEEMFALSKYLSLNTQIKQSDVLREALSNFLQQQDKDYLDKKIQEYNIILKKLEEEKKIMNLKNKNIQKLSKAEIEFLKESKDIIEKNPFYIEGRIESYINTFKKPYKLTKQDFFKLLIEAEDEGK